MNKFMYLNPRPLLVIESAGGGNLGRCYSAMSYKVTSKRKLSLAEITNLRESGFLGYGQEFYVNHVNHEGRHVRISGLAEIEPSGEDVIECSEVDHTGKVVACPATNPYSGQVYTPNKEPYYIYHCESRVDSSD